jgi:Zn-dependent protease/predicted transcriptional regulator
MLAQSIRLGRVFGIPIGVNYSWFIIFFLITHSLTVLFGELHPDWTYGGRIAFGVATSLLFFASVVLHELGHSVMALRYRIPVRSITLFVFGGIAQIGKEPEKPSHEFNIAIAGPLVSAALGGMFLGLQWLTQNSLTGVATLGGWLGGINLTLAAFNLVPGFPLDGGRILRAVAWRLTGSFERATTMAATSGQLLAYGFVFFGVIQAVAGNVLGGLWIAFIGWFLLSAAQMSSAQLRLQHALAGFTAADVMREECWRVDGGTPVANLVERMLRTGERCSMVLDGERLRGLVTLHQIKELSRDAWADTPARTIMVPEDRLSRVGPDTPLRAVLEKMTEDNVSQIPVVEHGRLVGVIGRDHLLAVVRNRLELEAGDRITGGFERPPRQEPN